ncbi:hypothetical protein WJ32_18595 (plasmid) [Burkholderia ubonensis]|uniref:Teneurin-like YD-shell domain-containing protein n=1 Tax=Burkholderia ubonensis TaxID=101571 RepID=A0A118HWE9_9BURK|nr:hypothetical protein [Burkholderia ubonensis]AOJ64589.1 hypothetical protein WJ32_18595 [Burkholderia ubonensis]KVG71133.1 hypothetical protein WJ33_21315 [Burkholderia ubonensis]
MVAIVTGHGLGLELGSYGTLGARGVLNDPKLGRNGIQVFLNAADGNLFVDSQDLLLAGLGVDLSLHRVYNSQGQLSGEPDNWALSLQRNVVLSAGAPNAAGSVVRRTDWDGSRVEFTFDQSQNAYVGRSASGVLEHITYDAGNARWTWTSADGTTTETYDAASNGRLLTSADAAGNTIHYQYDSDGRLTEIDTASGESTKLDYVDGRLAQLRVIHQSSDGSAAAAVTTRYSYDAAGRLSQVTTDLSPEDVSVADGNVYVTSYGYDGTSERIASISQSDGSFIAFSYDLSSGTPRVSQIMQRASDGVSRTTGIAYDSAGSRTIFTDPLGHATTLTYDSVGDLISIASPLDANSTQTVSYVYDGAGRPAQAIDGSGNAVDFQYDARGNLILQRDASGNVVSRSYDAGNRVILETHYKVADPDGSGPMQPQEALTTRYAYDAQGHLRFVVSAEGRVTEYRYSAQGLRTSEIHYSSALFDLSQLADDQSIDPSTLSTWVGSVDGSKSVRIDTAYDFRGLVSSVTSFARTDADGNGIADGTESTRRYAYDWAGRLLQSIDARAGSNTTGFVTSYSYDGLGRLLTSTSATGAQTVYHYDDAGRSVQVTTAGGLTTTSTYDLAGEVVGVSRTSAGQTLEATQSWYDADGRLVMTKDGSGVADFFVYDLLGRKVADIDSDGHVVEYSYNAVNQLTRETKYSNVLTAAQLASLVDSSGNPATTTLDAVRPSPSAADQSNWRIYDASHRLAVTVDGGGAVTAFGYDAADRLISSTRYATSIATGDLGTAPTLSQVSVQANVAVDRVTRNFYDADGRLIGTLDPEGALEENVYDAAGQLIEHVGYASLTSSAMRASGTLAQLRPAVDPRDVHTRYSYDGAGRKTAELNAEGTLTEYAYDKAGNLVRITTYATKVNYSAGATLVQIRPAPAQEDQTVVSTFDTSNRRTSSTDASGAIAQFAYDADGHLVQSTKAAGTSSAQTTQSRYDAAGRVIATLTGRGSVALAALTNPTQVQIDAVWAAYATRYGYDAAGHRISATDAMGNRTLFYYDADGRLSVTIDALGEVARTVYDGIGQVISTIRFGNRLSADTLSSMSGGLVDATLLQTLAAISSGSADSVTTSAYDDRGEVVSRTDELGNATSFTYDAFGELLTRTSPSSTGTVTTQFSYDRRGLRLTEVDDVTALARTSTTTYDAFGRIAEQVDGRGAIRTFTYDRVGRLLTSADPLGNVDQYGYDAIGRTVYHRDAAGGITTTAYDTTARSITVTSPGGIVTVVAADAAGEKWHVTDANGNVVSYAYDADGELTSVQTVTGTTSNAYDNAGRLVSTTDANGVVTQFEFDAANRIVRQTLDPSGLALTTTYTYDAKGHQLTMTRPDGIVVQSDYDLRGDLVRVITDPSGLNLQTTYTYDAEGHQVSVTRAANSATPQITRYSFDSLGRRISETIDPSGLALTTQYEYDANDNVVAKVDANGNRTRYVYDTDNRLVYKIGPAGNVERTDYDAAGRVTTTTEYATPANLSALVALPSLLQAAAVAVSDPVHDRVSHFAYDAAGRQAFAVDADGFVTQRQYDANGNVVLATQYAAALGQLSGYDVATLNGAVQSIANGLVDRTTRFAYDSANRLRFMIDPAGFITEQRYDASGNLRKTIAYATSTAIAGALDAANIAALVVQSPSDRTTGRIVDAAGRQVAQIDALGFVTKTDYDKLGNAVRTTRYAASVGAASPTSLSALMALLPGNAESTAVVIRSAFDAAGRLVFAVDAQGYVKETNYDPLGNISRTVLYAQPVATTGTPDVAGIRSLIAGQSNATANVVNSFVYDVGGRLVSSTDAEGHTESYTYDGLGNKLTFTNKMGAVWSYAYDARGLLVTETAPPIDVTSVDGALNVSTVTVPVVTQFTYDAFGQVIFKAEAVGRPEARVTAYSYDRRGHQTMIQYPLVSVYDAASDPLTQDSAGWRIERVIRPSTSTLYDAFGDAVVNVDVGGNANYKTYDKLGRIGYEVDAESYVTGYTYDGFGNKLTTTRYAQRIDLSAHAGAQPLFGADVAALLASQGASAHAGDRTITNAYDNAGRLVLVTEPAVFSYDPSVAGNQYSTSARVTANTYDAFGNLTSQTIGSSPALGAANRTFYYYDRNGQRVRQIDGLGYVTTFAYDAAGHLVSKTEFARAVPLDAVSVNGSPDPVANPPGQGSPDIGFDRWTSYAYDRVGHKLQEVQHGVQYSAVSGGSLVVDQGFADALTGYAYDALGNQVAVTDVKGDTTYTYYDAAGRTRAVVEPARALTVDGAQIQASPVTTFARDVFGNVVVRVQYARGASSASTAGFSLNGGSSADKATYSFFDSHGNEVRTVAGEGINTNRSYDAFGHVAREWTSFSEGDGVLRYKTTVYRYDLLGRQTDTLALSDHPSQLVSAGTLSSTNDNTDLLDEYGLVANAYQNQAGRGDYFNAASGTSEGQFILLRGAIDSFKATGDPKWKAIADKMASNLLQALYFTDSPPANATVTSLFAPHWLYNAKEDFVSDEIHYDKSFTVTNGRLVIPDGGDTHGELIRNVFHARTVGSKFIWDNPYSDLKSTPGAQKYDIASYTHVDGVGEVVQLTQPINGKFLVTYTTQTGEVVHKGEPYEAWPYWRKLQPNEIDSAMDVLSWAYDAFNDLYSMTSDSKWQNAAKATLQTASIVYQFDDGKAWLHPTIGDTPFDIGGTYKYVQPGRAEPNWSRDAQGNAVIDIPADSGDVQYGIGVNQTLDGGDIKVQMGADRSMDVEVFFDTEQDNYLSRRSALVHLDGTGMQVFRLKLSDFKQTYSGSGEHLTTSMRDFLPTLAAGDHIYTLGVLVSGWPQPYSAAGDAPVTQGKLTLALMRPWDETPQTFVPRSVAGRPWINRTSSGNPFDLPGSFSWGNRSNNGADVPVNWTRNANGDLTADLGASTSGESQYGIGIPEVLNGTGIYLQVGSSVAQTLRLFLDPVQGDYAQRRTIDVSLSGNGLDTIYIPFSQLGLTAGSTVYTIGISDTNTATHTLTLRQIGQYVDGAPITYAPAAVPFTANLTGSPQQLIGWRGPIYIGYQSPTMWAQITATDGDGSATDPNRVALNSLLNLMKAAQDDYQLKLGTRGPFTPAFYPDRTDGLQYGSPNSFGWGGPDPNTRWEGYEYRALQEAAKYWESDRGNGTAASITMDFLSWLNSNWTSAATTPPTDFPENLSAWSGGTYYAAGAVVRSTTKNGYVYQALTTGTSGGAAPGWPTTIGTEFSDGGVTWRVVGNDYGTAYSAYVDPHAVALILRSAMYADLAGGDQSVTRPLIRRALDWLRANRASGDMTGTWSPDPANKQWFGFWSGEIATSLSLLMQRGSGILSAVGFSASTLTEWLSDSATWITNHSSTQLSKLSFFQGTKQQVAYDAFGDITAKGINDGWQEYYRYDNAGRLWSSNQGGTNQAFLYNVAGQRTATITSQTQDLHAYSDAASVAALTDGVSRTTVTYDVLGRVIRSTQASFQNESDSTMTTPAVNYAYDRWNNVIATSDPRNGGLWTRYQYDAGNHMVVEIDPTATLWQESGSSVNEIRQNAVKRYGYDLGGVLVSETDGNGNRTLHQVDSAGNVTADFFADGASQVYAFDAFNRRTMAIDPSQDATSYTYDRSDRLIRQDAGYTSIARTYDELGHVIVEQSGNGTRRYKYDAFGNRLSSTIPGGQSSLFEYDSRGRVVKQIDVDSNVSTWKYDYFGRLISRRDVGGADYSYTYDWASDLVKEVNSRGKSIDFTYYGNGALHHVYDNSVSSIGQAATRGADTLYEYDAAGNRIHERYQLWGEVLQDTHSTYDELNRLTSATDPFFTVNYKYDAVGNRREVLTTFTDTDGHAQGQDYWYLYDSRNRMTVSQGVYQNGGVSITQGQGTILGYDASGDRRLAQTYVQKSGSYSLQTEEYGYDTGHRLTTTTRNGVLVIGRVYDAGSRLTQITNYNDDGSENSRQETDYDANGWQKDTRVYTPSAGAQVVQEYKYQTDPLGNVIQYSYRKNTTDDGNQTYNDSTRYSYTAFDSYKQSQSVVTRRGSVWASGSTQTAFDGNGNAVYVHVLSGSTFAVQDALVNGTWSPQPDDVLVKGDYTGQVYAKTINGKTQRYFYVNGHEIGTNSLSGISSSDNAAALSNPYYTAVSERYPPTAPITYTVRTGDTLRSIASDVLGDANLWYVIADANGIQDDSQLSTMVDQVVSIPPRVTNIHNDVTTFRPFSAKDALGSIAPKLPDPPPVSHDDGGGCGIIGAIIIAVVAVVATVVTAGAAAIAMGAVAEGTGLFAAGAAALTGAAGTAGFAAAVVGGAVGSMVSQAVGVGLGIQDRFSWSAVAASAIGAGVGAGVGAVMGPLSQSSTLAEIAAQRVTSNAVTQGVDLLVGQQHRFDWAGVAAAAISAPLQSAAGALMPGGGEQASAFSRLATQTATNATTGLVSQELEILEHHGGRLNADSIAADAFGNALGQSVVDHYMPQNAQVDDAYQQVRSAAHAGDPGDAVLFGPNGFGDPWSGGSTGTSSLDDGHGFTDPVFGNMGTGIGLVTGVLADGAVTPLGGVQPFYAQFDGPMPGVMVASNNLTVSDAGTDDPYPYVRAEGYDGTIYVQASRTPLISEEAAATGLAYGAGYDGALSGLTSASLGYGSDVALNASSLRAATSGGESTFDAFVRGATGGYAGVLDTSPNAAYAGKLLNDAGQSFRQFGYQMIGGQSADEARAAWGSGDYGLAAAKEVQALGEAGLSLIGMSPLARAAAAPTMRAVAAFGEYAETKVGSLGEPYGLGLRLSVTEGGGVVAPNSVAAADAAAGSGTSTVFRVQGGVMPNASKTLITLDANGSPIIQNGTLNISIGDASHAEYFQTLRPNSTVTAFEIPSWLDDFIHENAISQDFYRSNPLNQGGLAPKIVDPTTPGRSYELPSPWGQWLQENAIPGSGKVK